MTTAYIGNDNRLHDIEGTSMAASTGAGPVVSNMSVVQESVALLESNSDSGKNEYGTNRKARRAAKSEERKRNKKIKKLLRGGVSNSLIEVRTTETH